MQLGSQAVAPAVSGDIVDRLLRISQERGVDVLLAVEAGSRAWGFHSPDSDYDVRFIYRRPLSHYMSVHERRDVLEPAAAFPYDYAGWDIKKALFQMHRGNPALFEWLQSPIVYIDVGFRERLQALMVSYFNPRSAIYHYLHMAAGNYRTYIEGNATPRLKKYLYVVRPLLACQWIEGGHTMPTVDFDDLLTDVLAPETAHLEKSIFDLVARKRVGDELGEGPAIPVLNAWIEERITHFNRAARTTAKSNRAADDLDEFFFNTVVR